MLTVRSLSRALSAKELPAEEIWVEGARLKRETAPLEPQYLDPAQRRDLVELTDGIAQLDSGLLRELGKKRDDLETWLKGEAELARFTELVNAASGYLADFLRRGNLELRIPGSLGEADALFSQLEDSSRRIDAYAVPALPPEWQTLRPHAHVRVAIDDLAVTARNSAAWMLALPKERSLLYRHENVLLASEVAAVGVGAIFALALSVMPASGVGATLLHGGSLTHVVASVALAIVFGVWVARINSEVTQHHGNWRNWYNTANSVWTFLAAYRAHLDPLREALSRQGAYVASSDGGIKVTEMRAAYPSLCVRVADLGRRS
jgi:hypothetical protein